MTNDTEMAGILCARICHDLGSPLGAVANGVDLLRQIGGNSGSEEIEILGRSAERAAALLRFHRLAFGVVRDPESVTSRDELRRLADAVLAGPRVAIRWTGAEAPPLETTAARLAALMLLAGRSALGAGGALQVVLPAAGGLPVAVIAEGASVALSDARRRWLRGAPGPLPDAPEVEFALIPGAAKAAGARVELVEGEGRVALRAAAA